MTFGQFRLNVLRGAVPQDRDRVDVAEKDRVGGPIGRRDLGLEVLEDVQLRVERVPRVPVRLVAPGPAEGLALGDFHARTVDAQRLEVPGDAPVSLLEADGGLGSTGAVERRQDRARRRLAMAGQDVENDASGMEESR